MVAVDEMTVTSVRAGLKEHVSTSRVVKEPLEKGGGASRVFADLVLETAGQLGECQLVPRGRRSDSSQLDDSALKSDSSRRDVSTLVSDLALREGFTR